LRTFCQLQNPQLQWGLDSQAQLVSQPFLSGARNGGHPPHKWLGTESQTAKSVGHLIVEELLVWLEEIGAVVALRNHDFNVFLASADDLPLNNLISRSG
jgi:hypothetical protein